MRAAGTARATSTMSRKPGANRSTIPVTASVAFQRELAIEEDRDARKALDAQGCEVVELTADEHVLFAKAVEPLWADAVMGLKDLPNVLDLRCVGLTAGIDLASRPDAVGRRAYDAMVTAFNDQSLMIRSTGDTLALTPPLIVSEREIEEIFAKVAKVIRAVA